MPMSSHMQIFKDTLDRGDYASAARQVRFNPTLAQEHATDEKGNYVTALDLSMDTGNLSLVDQVLRSGARMDLPIGEPPSHNWYGATAMTKALLAGYAKNPNGEQIFGCMARHYGERLEEARNQPLMTRLGAAVSTGWEKIKNLSTDLMSGNQFVVGQALRERQNYAARLFDEEVHSQMVMLATNNAVRGLLDPNDAQHAAVIEVMAPRP